MIQRRYIFNVPVQYCHFHQVQTVTKYTTKKPKTDCGKDLRNLILELKNLNKKDFIKKFKQLTQTYNDFLKEKLLDLLKTTFHIYLPFKSIQSLKFPPQLTQQMGSFGQWKKKFKLHNGISRNRKMQMIDKVLANNSG